jgi:enoyl-CoA hydratase
MITISIGTINSIADGGEGAVTDDNNTSPTNLARRDLIGISAGAAVFAAGLGAAQAQTAQLSKTPPWLIPPQAKPGRVVVEKRGAVLLIGIDRPDGRNLLDAPVLIGLGKAYYQLDRDDDLRVGILHGLGPDFSFGLDGPAFVAARAAGILPVKDPDYIHPFGLYAPFRTKPLVAAVHGGVWYGAHELFLAADIRVAANDASFSQGEVARGVFPGGGATVRFTREAGWGNAMRYMLTGDTWGAEEARRMGLLCEITEPGKQLDRAIELAQKVAAAAPLGVRATLASAYQSLTGEEAAFASLLVDFPRITQTADPKEARRAAEEGRAPVFKGN